MWNEHCESLSLPQPNQKNDYYGSQKRKKCFCATEYDPIEPSGRDAQCDAPSDQDEGNRVPPVSFTNDHRDSSSAESQNKWDDGGKRDLQRGRFPWNSPGGGHFFSDFNESIWILKLRDSLLPSSASNTNCKL
jgi:hypothetical protein